MIRDVFTKKSAIFIMAFIKIFFHRIKSIIKFQALFCNRLYFLSSFSLDSINSSINCFCLSASFTRSWVMRICSARFKACLDLGIIFYPLYFFPHPVEIKFYRANFLLHYLGNFPVFPAFQYQKA